VMIVETKYRSLTKAITWRIIATLTTIVLVYIFFGRLELAAALGGLEVLLKLLFNFLHERAWLFIKFGKKKMEPFVLWFTGLPACGKTTIADLVFEELSNRELEIERLDGRDIRKLYPEVGFTREERIAHLKRVSHMIRLLEKNNVSVVASFISPYTECRDEIRKMIKENFIEIYVKASVESCKKRDTKNMYNRAEKGEIKNFTGVSDVYEEPRSPHLVLDTESLTAEQCAEQVIQYVEKNLLTR
jgi:adenylylsulfate kinase